MKVIVNVLLLLFLIGGRCRRVNVYVYIYRLCLWWFDIWHVNWFVLFLFALNHHCGSWFQGGICFILFLHPVFWVFALCVLQQGLFDDRDKCESLEFTGIAVAHLAAGNTFSLFVFTYCCSLIYNECFLNVITHLFIFIEHTWNTNYEKQFTIQRSHF